MNAYKAVKVVCLFEVFEIAILLLSNCEISAGFWMCISGKSWK